MIDRSTGRSGRVKFPTAPVGSGHEIPTGSISGIVATVIIIIYQSSKIRTGPLYYSIVGTVITNQGTHSNTGPLY